MRQAKIAIAVALLVGAGCGGCGGGGQGQGDAPATPTPAVATPSPAPTAPLVLTLRATADVAAVSFSVGYEAGRGAIAGSGAQAQCQLASGDALAVNDDDAGTLQVAIVAADPLRRPTLALPTTLTCAFDATGGALRSADVRIGSTKVGVIDAGGVVVAGDASLVDVR